MEKPNNFDINKMIAEFITMNMKDFIEIGKGVYKDKKETLQVKLRNIYSHYLTNTYERYGRSKSFFIRDEPQELSTFYVPVGLASNKLKIKNANLRAILSHNSQSIITGSAGSGKSILLKHLLINALRDKNQVPVFIELRDINISNLSMEKSIRYTFNCFGLELEETFIKKAFQAGQFVLMLDGLDEINTDKRKDIVKEIDTLIKEYPNTKIIITTRPDSLTSEFQTFTVYRTLPLSLDQCISLVEKLPADEKIKEKFILDLKLDLFKKHESFLSNPLLLTIMLLTYGYSTDIPSKLSIFYYQAFEALFQRHDTMKGAYKRVRETELDIQDFEKVLNVFCIQTYDDRRFQLTRKQVLDYLDKAKQIVNVEFKSESFLNDLLQAVCILIEDGLFITFSHRSFQEYFAAKFIVSSEPMMKKRLLKKYELNIMDDNIYKLVHELDSDFLEYEIIYPFIDDLFKKIGLKNKVGITHFFKFTKIMWVNFYFSQGSMFGRINEKQNTNNLVRFIIFELDNSNYSKKYLNRGIYTPWIEKNIELSKNTDEKLEFQVVNLKYSDEIIKELYNSKGYFSKKTLEILQKTMSNLQLKKKNKTEKLEEFLFKKEH